MMISGNTPKHIAPTCFDFLQLAHRLAILLAMMSCQVVNVSLVVHVVHVVRLLRALQLISSVESEARLHRCSFQRKERVSGELLETGVYRGTIVS